MRVKIPAVTIPAKVIEVCDLCEKPQARPLQCCRVCGRKYCGRCHGFPIFFCKDCYDRADVKVIVAKYERKSKKLFSEYNLELRQLGKTLKISEPTEKKRKCIR